MTQNGQTMPSISPDAELIGYRTKNSKSFKQQLKEFLKSEDFQNYCNLTLDNMVVTAGPSTQYVASNNYGSLNMKNGTTLNAEGGCAFDVYYWPSNSYEEGVRVVILDNTVVINGSIEYGDDGSGDFEDFIANTSLKVPEKYEDIIVISENAKYDYDWSAPDVDGFITLQVSQK